MKRRWGVVEAGVYFGMMEMCYAYREVEGVRREVVRKS